VGSIGVLNGVPGPNTGVGADKIQTTNTWSENTVGLLYFFDSGSE
jgi:hypothetical protein